MGSIWIAVYIVGGFVAVVLALLLLRGRFGTPAEQGRYDLAELAASGEVPSDARLREIATCRGQTRDTRSVVGAGVLWLTDDRLGFVLRRPRRKLDLALASVVSVTVTGRYERVGIVETSPADDFVVVEWDVDGSRESICFQVRDPQHWADAIGRIGA